MPIRLSGGDRASTLQLQWLARGVARLHEDAANLSAETPELPKACLVVGVTGHRSSHPSFPADTTTLDAAIDHLLGLIDQTVTGLETPAGPACHCTTRMVTLLADGTDHHAAMRALERGWDLVTPLPFGRALNAAINARAKTLADVDAILAGETASDPDTAARVAAIDALAAKARLFELADQDDGIAALLRQSLADTAAPAVHERLEIATARRAAMAGLLMVEQSDLVIAVWDGLTVDSVGGTGHTAWAALELGVPVVWIDPGQPDIWRLFLTAEELAADQPQDPAVARAALARQIGATVSLQQPQTAGRFAGIAAIGPESWRARSSPLAHAYRRIETLFGQHGWGNRLRSIRQRYERPEDIGKGSARALLDALATLPGQDPALAGKIEREVLRRFAWCDGIASHLADRYRSGMVVNFVLGAAAIVVGILYLPLVSAEHKWVFASLELAFLVAIVANTARGQRRRLHGRWFETRRAAEYLRHSPFLLAAGVARAAGRWPQGVKSWWPEWYARHALSAVGLPHVRVDDDYLRGVLTLLRDHHVGPQLAYHREKAARLGRVHHRLDELSEYSFAAAIMVVGGYLILALLAGLGYFDSGILAKMAKWFTVVAVALPTLGGAIAAIRYFGDFERFGEISAVTAGKLEPIAHRIDMLISAPSERLDFAAVAKIAHDADDVVFSEIENWQAVFSGKRTTIPA